MRSSRFTKAVLAVLTGSALAAAPATAQQPATTWDVQPNSWYWGVYGGQTSLFTNLSSTVAPTIGIDWLITRSAFALNVFAEQAYFNAQSTVTTANSAGPVAIQDMRRVGMSLMLYLPNVRIVHPYVGGGYAFNYLTKASAVAPPADTLFAAAIENERSQGRIFASVGAMIPFRQFAPFAEVSMMPTKGTSSWMVNGDRSALMWKAGLRYNFGSSTSGRF